MYISTDTGSFMYHHDDDSGISEYCSSGENSPVPLSPLLSPIGNSFQDPYNYLTYVPYYDVCCVPFPQPQPQYFSFPPCDVQTPIEPSPPVPTVVEQLKHVPAQSNHAFAPVGRLIKWTLPPPSVPHTPLPGWDSMPYAMEQFWQSAFAWFFHPIWATNNHVWTMTPTAEAPPVDEWPWHYLSYSAKVRFQCPYKHGWTSMKGRVSFWYRMKRVGAKIVCEVLFKLYGQQCNRCNNPKQPFLPPLWYHEEIENAIRFLSTEVAKLYYGGESLPMPRRLRQGNPRKDTHHDPTRCQACQEGICVIRY